MLSVINRCKNRFIFIRTDYYTVDATVAYIRAMSLNLNYLVS